MNVAAILFGFARHLCPPRRREWIDAMQSEAAHFGAGVALSWAIGCVVAVVKVRLGMFFTHSLKVSRWVILVEMLCFVPITIGWWDAVAGDSGVIHLNADIASRYFLTSAQGTYVLGMMIAAATVGLAGPIGLIFAARYFLTGRGISSAGFGLTLIAGVGLWGVASIGARIVFGEGAYSASMGSLLLLVIQPVAALAHLMYLARPQSNSPAPSLAVA